MMRVPARQLSRLGSLLALATLVAACDVAVDGHGGLQLGAASARATDQWTRTYAAAPGARLEIVNVNGRITAEATDGREIEVRAERTARAGSEESARDLLNRVEMREEASESRVRIEVRAPRISGLGGHDVQWTVRVPRGVSVDLRTVNGGVRMTGLEGEVRARSTNGGITGTGLAASSLEASVTNGGVEIDLAKAVSGGTFELEAVNGGVSLNLPSDSHADIVGRCVNGGISTSGLPLEVVGEQTRRRIEARLNGGGARVSLKTVNGGVRIGSAGSAAE